MSEKMFKKYALRACYIFKIITPFIMSCLKNTKKKQIEFENMDLKSLRNSSK